jgi:hypothetical protein
MSSKTLTIRQLGMWWTRLSVGISLSAPTTERSIVAERYATEAEIEATPDQRVR